MGKKRRYINRAAKFGKKMFNFLDNLDGVQDSNLADSRIDTSISKISITDRGNRTYAIQVEGRGPGDSTAKDNLEQDTVKLTVDGTVVHGNNFLVFAAPPGGSANDRDRFKTTMVAPAPADDQATAGVVLSAASHTIIAQIMKENKTDPLSKEKSKKFSLVEPKKDLSLVTCAEGAGGQAGQIKIAATDDINVAAAASAGAKNEAAGRLPGEEAFTLGTGGAANDLQITVKDKDGTDVEIKADTHYTVAVGNKVATTTANTTQLQAGLHIRKRKADGNFEAFPHAAGPYTVTITPKLVGGTLHTPSAITFTVPIAE